MAGDLAPAATTPQPGEFDLSDADFERLRELIYLHAGISLGAGKRQMVYSRLIRRLRILGLKDFRDYLLLIEADEGGERQAFTNALTTNLTALAPSSSFCRAPYCELVSVTNRLYWNAAYETANSRARARSNHV